MAESSEVESLRETVRQLSSQASRCQGHKSLLGLLAGEHDMMTRSVQVARLKQELGAIHGTEAVALR